MRKKKYEIDDNFYIKVDDNPDTDPIDRVTVFTKNWNRTKEVGLLCCRKTVTAAGKVLGVSVRLGGKVVSVAFLSAVYVLGHILSPRQKIRHKDGDPTNNHPDNIEVVSKTTFMKWIRKGGFNKDKEQ
jgi:hypothetical protein